MKPTKKTQSDKKLTKVQRDVLERLARESGGRATVGRGLSFKCNRITARSLRDLGLVTTDARQLITGVDEVPFFVELTSHGREAVTALSGSPT